MPGVTSWKGEYRDLVRLKKAIERHCECKQGQPMCSAHRMMADQRTLDHFAFVGRRRESYLQDDVAG